jgi:hypothetical protein
VAIVDSNGVISVTHDSECPDVPPWIPLEFIIALPHFRERLE